MKNDYYTYAYLREDGTPYYVGKGSGNRAYKGKRHGYWPPKDPTRILLLKRNLTEDEAFRHECYIIFLLGRKDLGTGILYNQTNGGDGKSGWVMPQEVKDKIGRANKGKTSWMKGKPAHNRGVPASEETREKCRQASTGRVTPSEVRKKISAAKKGKPLPPACYGAIRTPVLGTNPKGDIFYYESATEASRMTNIQRSHISACCRGERKTAGKWTWTFFG
jgi:hypothetical protein